MESIVNIEHPDGAVVQFGGQTAIKLTESLMKMGVPILGTKAEDVDAAEDRELFDKILEETGKNMVLQKLVQKHQKDLV